MKKIIALILALCLCVGLCACGAENQFTIEELNSALLSEGIEFDDSVINQTETGFDFLFEANELLVSGTADEDQNVTYVMFANIGLDVTIFDDNSKFEKWLARVSTMDMNASVREILEMSVAYSCIEELVAFYRLTNGEGDSGLFAVNTLLRKESSEVDGWTVKVSVDPDERILVTEVIGAKANTSKNPIAEAKEMIAKEE